MTIARELADFLTRTTIDDLPAAAVDHAAMLIASTIASAAFGSGIEFGGDHPHARPRARRAARRLAVVRFRVRGCRWPTRRRSMR